MEDTNNVYIELQQHLDKQAVGFPATKSGVEIRILKQLFNPEQASLALYLNYQPQSALDIYNNAKVSGLSSEKVKTMLEGMVDNGAIGIMEIKGIEHYYTMPLLVGIVEWHDSRATPNFGADLGEYMRSGFIRTFARTKTSQMRTVPVEKSLTVEQHVMTYDDIREIIKNTPGPITVSRCMCREGAEHRGNPCHQTSRLETCMSFGDWARHFINKGSREITRKEALEITRQNEEDGLVLQPTNYQKIDFICACCGCCCGILNILKVLPKPAENWAHNYFAEIDTEKCVACGICVEKCQMNAVKINEQKGYSEINLDRCIGCGNCVVSCPSEALRLVSKEKETVPPEDRTSLYKILAEK
jgi:Na+-translocating ferredoxin:NAD+ oxidoreductase subunit B